MSFEVLVHDVLNREDQVGFTVISFLNDRFFTSFASAENVSEELSRRERFLKTRRSSQLSHLLGILAVLDPFPSFLF